jgi:tRNA (cytidine/uridine-2'-O-)-methyltransferase
MTRIALYQPDIPQNTGAAIRLCACLDIGLDIIEPCGFLWDDRKIRRSAMDYADAVNMERHKSWDTFYDRYKTERRIVLMTTRGATPYTDFHFQPDDILLAGRESAGVPDNIHDAADARIVIPMKNNLRSLNIINATAMIAGEALRQIDLRQTGKQ